MPFASPVHAATTSPQAARYNGLSFIIRRFVLLVFISVSTASACALMAGILGANGWTPIRGAEMVLFAISFTGLALSFWVAALGFVVRLIGGDPESLLARTDMSRALLHQTAIVMPIYNEDTARVAAGLEATLNSLIKLPEHENFEVFVVSDTRKPEIAAAEERAFSALKARFRDRVAVHYRRRERNIGRKAGNLHDFIERWGGAYAHMIVLDADSVMSGETLVALARTMEQHPEAGLIQTVPVPVNRETPFARLLQFANCVYGPIMSAGLAFWSGGSGNYYGHNAIIRVSAFAAHCGLPVLPGRAPLGGDIMSHDFVEAALLRRAGYKVWIVPELAGSYEEMPANIIDYATRDRRWTQGNLQHAKVMTLPRLPWVSRLHMAMGIMGYAASPIWVALLLLASIDIAQQSTSPIVYFRPGFNLFPAWPVSKAHEIIQLLVFTIAALFVPKLLGLATVLFSRSKRRSFGGMPRLFLSAMFEMLFSVLLAPVMALFQSQFVIATLCGRSVGWEAQPRDDRGLAWREALRRHLVHMAIGVAWGAVIWRLSPGFFWWLAPFLTGLSLAVPVSYLSSRVGFGLWLKRMGLFLIPEEASPPPLLRDLQALSRRALSADLIVSTDLTPREAPLIMPIPAWPAPITKQPIPELAMAAE